MPRVDTLRTELASLPLSEAASAVVDRRVETEFVYSAATFAGAQTTRERIAHLIESVNAGTPQSAQTGEMQLLRALRLIKSLAKDAGTKLRLTPELLLRLHDPAQAAAASLRGSPAELNEAFTPPAPERIPVALQSACMWFAAESFEELHPAEQSAIVLLKLLEIQPFDTGNDRTAVAAASLFTVREGLPPIIINQTQDFRAALREGFNMNTRPLVELIAGGLAETLAELIAIAKQGR